MPEFRTSITTLFEGCTALANKLLEMIGHALKLEVSFSLVVCGEKIKEIQHLRANLDLKLST